MINRSAITVRAKQPFLDWLQALPDPVGPETTLARVNSEPHVYLLPEYGMLDEQEDLIEEFFDLIFECQLAGWWTDDTDWPRARTASMFKQWFDVEFHSMIRDLTALPLLDED